MSPRERIAYWCYDHPISAAVALYLVTVIPALLLTMMLVESGSGRAVALPMVLAGPGVVAVIGHTVWRSGPPEHLSARDR